eukprot:g5238.t1
MSLMNEHYQPKVKRNRGLLVTVRCVAVSSLQIVGGVLYIDQFDSNLDSVVGVASVLVMIPAFLSIVMSGSLLSALSVWGSEQIMLGFEADNEPSRAKLKRPLLSDMDVATKAVDEEEGRGIEEEEEEEEVLPGRSGSCCRGRCVLKVALFLHSAITFLIVMITFIVSCIVVAFWHIIVSKSNHKEHWLRSLTFWLIEASSIALHVCSIWASVKFCWTSQKSVAKRLLLAANIFVAGIAISILIMNHEFSLYHIRSHQWLDEHDSVRVGTNVCAVLLIIRALLGIGTSFVTFGRMGDKFLSSTSMPLPYLIFSYAVSAVTFCFVALNLTFFLVILTDEGGSSYDDAAAATGANALVGLLVLAANYFEHRAYSFLLNPHLPSGFDVEEIDLSSTPKSLLKRWGRMMDLSSGLKHVGARDGDGALALMQMYQSNPCDGMKSVCLRVYERGVDDGEISSCDGRGEEGEGDVNASTKTSETGTAGDPEEGGRAPSWIFDAREEGVKGSTVAIVFVTVVERFDLTQYVKIPYVQDVLHWLFGSRSYLPLLCLRFGLVGFQWPFASGVFLCRKPRAAGTFLTPASEVRFRKFIDSIPCNSAESGGGDPETPMPMVNRMTRVLRATVEWNDAQMSASRCTVLMLPSYITQLESFACNAATFVDTAVAPSSIVDLRYYKAADGLDDGNEDVSNGARTKQKQKKMKRRQKKKHDVVTPYDRFRRHALTRNERKQHEKFFIKQGGTIHICEDFQDFDKDYANVMFRLWNRIASKRVG